VGQNPEEHRQKQGQKFNGQVFKQKVFHLEFSHSRLLHLTTRFPFDFFSTINEPHFGHFSPVGLSQKATLHFG
jgi:hypothetical protein